MTRYVKVTLKEFESMRSAVESGLKQSGCWDNEQQLSEIKKAAKASRSIELRNKINGNFNYDNFI